MSPQVVAQFGPPFGSTKFFLGYFFFKPEAMLGRDIFPVILIALGVEGSGLFSRHQVNSRDEAFFQELPGTDTRFVDHRIPVKGLSKNLFRIAQKRVLLLTATECG